MKLCVISFPGSNCDRDCVYALRDVLGHEVCTVWHTAQTLPDAIDALILPGGFAHGDYLRPGAIASVSPIMGAVHQFTSRGGAILGICNGFQILLESGLLPGAMLPNASPRFVCRHQALTITTQRPAWQRASSSAGPLVLPIAHAHGNYFIDEAGLDALREHDQILLTYAPHDPPRQRDPAPYNPNGSVADIAGICDRSGRVVGMMPHPERACEAMLGSEDGARLFAAFFDAALS